MEKAFDLKIKKEIFFMSPKSRCTRKKIYANSSQSHKQKHSPIWSKPLIVKSWSFIRLA